ncbi:type IV pilus secretin PilQ [Magnetococcales bacterium HHB-1]
MNPRTGFYAALVGLLILATGCQSTSFTKLKAKKKEGTLIGMATEITHIQAMDAGPTTRITLRGNGKIRYRLFQLNDPPRLMLTLPKTKLSPVIQPRKLKLQHVTALYPMENAKHDSSQVEVVLRNMAQYRIKEEEHGLEVVLHNEATVPQATDPMIRDVLASDLESATVVDIVGQGEIPPPRISRLNTPPRIILDLAVPADAVKKRMVPISSAQLTSIQIGKGKDKTRLIVNLADAAVTHALEQEQGHLRIRFFNPAQVVVKPQAITGGQITDIQFSQEGQRSLIKILTNKQDLPMDSSLEDQNLLLTLSNVQVPDRLVRRMDVSDFSSPVSAIDVFNEDSASQIIVRLNDEYKRHQIVQQGEAILIQVDPKGMRSDGVGDERYTGRRISMDFNGIDIHNALKLLADIGDINIITSDSVQGTVSMRLIDVPWDQALELILEAKGLGTYQHQGNVIRIAPLAEIKDMGKAKLVAEESKRQLESLVNAIIPVSFADATELHAILSQGNPSQGTGLLSSRGMVIVDKRTNALIAYDLADNIEKIRVMVKQLDKPIPQVLISARIVEVARNNTKNLGINWGFNAKEGRHVGISTTASNAYAVQQSDLARTGSRASMSAASQAVLVGATTGTGFNFIPDGVQSSMGVHIGSMNPLLDLDIELGALEEIGKSKIISSPKVLTTNNQEATINQGTRLPYETISSEGTQTTFVEATLSLKVTPKVTPDGFVTLKVKVTNNTQGTGSTPPPINTKEVETQVLVRHGQTIVLGGIFTNTELRNNAGIPKLRTIPFFKWLFGNVSDELRNTEMLIFITPKVVEPVRG